MLGTILGYLVAVVFLVVVACTAYFWWMDHP
jgi:hypothetical protein